MLTYGDLAGALRVLAQHRGIVASDGPALLALSAAAFPRLAAWEAEAVARLVWTAGADGAVAMPSVAA